MALSLQVETLWLCGTLCLHCCTRLHLDPLTFHQATGASRFRTRICFELCDLLKASVSFRLQRSQSTPFSWLTKTWVLEPSCVALADVGIFILNNISAKETWMVVSVQSSNVLGKNLYQEFLWILSTHGLTYILTPGPHNLIRTGPR